APSSVALTAGWNLVGYCGTAAKALTDALQSISGQYSAVWAYVNGAWKLYDPANAGFSDLSQMEPGYGYWIKATQGCVLNFGGSAAGTTISPANGGTVSASDGASVSLAPDFGSSDITVSFSKLADASGATVDDRKLISAQYSLQIAGAETISGNINLSIPVDKKLLPSGATSQQAKSCLRPEISDTGGSTWTPAGTMITYDEGKGVVTFDVSSLYSAVSASSSMKRAPRGIKAQAFDFRKVSLIELSWRMFNATMTENNPPFKIYYYPPEPKNENSIPTAWQKHTTGTGYNFIVDLYNTAQTETAGLNAIRNSSNKAIIGDQQARDIEIYVVNTGDSSGVTPLGGPVVLSNTDFLQGVDADNWTAMRTTTAHELVHFFQGPIYGTYESNNRWFIEATAQYYAARVAGFDAANPGNPVPVSDYEKQGLYGGESKDDAGNYKYEYLADYLTVSITDKNNQSYYALGHFLEYLEKRFSQPIVADVLSERTSDDDLENLNSVLKTSLDMSVGDALVNYIANLMVDPELLGNFNRAIKDKMAEHASGYLTTAEGQPTTPWFMDKFTFKRLKKPLSLLSAVYSGFLSEKLSRDCLLVIDSHDIAQMWKGNMKSFVYAFGGSNTTKAAYSGNNPIDNGIEFPFTNTVNVPNFGGTKTGSKKLVEHMIINYDQEGTKPLNMCYYILMRPKITQVGQGSSNGMIVWDTDGIGTKGGIPADYIKGYDVFDKGGKKLNDKIIPLPSAAGSGQSFENAAIDPIKQTAADFTVVIEDKYGNRWPEVSEGKVIINSISCDSAPAYAKVRIDGKGFGNTQGTSTVTLNGNPITSIVYWYDAYIYLLLPGTATTGDFVVTVNGEKSNLYPYVIDTQFSSKLAQRPSIGVNITASPASWCMDPKPTEEAYELMDSILDNDPHLILTQTNPGQISGSFHRVKTYAKDSKVSCTVTTDISFEDVPLTSWCTCYSNCGLLGICDEAYCADPPTFIYSDSRKPKNKIVYKQSTTCDDGTSGSYNTDDCIYPGYTTGVELIFAK
ncbi:MAG: hypothetical protein NTV89_19190, partial [Proteobacteria bacterium]|nr:hypothetical protein [Pseudomonadota bacterium]